jgi:hypothetical protein
MPNASISVYLNDADYSVYVRIKKSVNVLVRQLVKEELQKITE